MTYLLIGFAALAWLTVGLMVLASTLYAVMNKTKVVDEIRDIDLREIKESGPYFLWLTLIGPILLVLAKLGATKNAKGA